MKLFLVISLRFLLGILVGAAVTSITLLVGILLITILTGLIDIEFEQQKFILSVIAIPAWGITIVIYMIFGNPKNWENL